MKIRFTSLSFRRNPSITAPHTTFSNTIPHILYLELAGDKKKTVADNTCSITKEKDLYLRNTDDLQHSETENAAVLGTVPMSDNDNRPTCSQVLDISNYELTVKHI